MKKQTIRNVGIILILIIVLAVFMPMVIKEIDKSEGYKPKAVEEKKKAIKAEDVEEGEVVSDFEINLGNYDSNVTIKNGGEYQVNGVLNNTLLINSSEDVILNLNGANIRSKETAAIANIGEGTLTLKLADDTTNSMSDGGSSEYDACIYSKGAINIEGNGMLKVEGKQEEGEGIATETNNITINSGIIDIQSNDDGINAGGDGGEITINGGQITIKANGDGIDSNKNLIINGGDIYCMGSTSGGNAGIDTEIGYVVNGGTIVALGTDMLEEPEKDSKQKTACFNLNEYIPTGTRLLLKDEKEQIMATLIARQDFKTLITSNPNIVSGTYYLYKDDEKTEYKVEIP